MTALVVDVSIVGCWALDDEHHPTASAALETVRQDGGLAPRLFRHEMLNLLVVNERRGRLQESETAAFLRSFSLLPIALDERADEPHVLTLARRHRLTVYDAAYLELAVRGGGALASLDVALTRAAVAEGVEVLGSRA